MRMRRAQHKGPGLARQVHVVAEAAGPDHQPCVLFAAYWLTYPLRHVALMSLALVPAKIDYLPRLPL
jgi:hypothetical protein